MLQRLIFVLLIGHPWPFHAQTDSTKPVEIQGHFIGESVAELLNKEPVAQQEVNLCEQNARKPNCDRLLAAVKKGSRAEFSTPNWTRFVLDGGKLVKMTALVNGTADTAKADLTRKFGSQSSEAAFPMRNAMGAGWEDHLSVWDTPTVYLGLREDNNPASQNHHLVLVIESRAEHEREHAEGAKN